MGAGIARSLARAGHEVAAWNRSPEKVEALAGDGILAAETVGEAVAGSDAVLTVLFDIEALLAVADEIVGALGPESVWLQVSTVGPSGARQAAELAGGRLLDTPVLGTKKPAEEGNLVVFVSGPPGLVPRAEPVFDAIGSRRLVAGDEVGQASALKLAVNAWVGLITTGTAQSLALAESLGVDPALFLDAIAGSAVDSPYAHVKGRAMLAGDWTTSFAVDGALKDIDLMLDAAVEASFPTGLLIAVRERFAEAAACGHGEDDMASVRTAFGGMSR
jgi:3-hydroxyisobutyrate dehydrogenase